MSTLPPAPPDPPPDSGLRTGERSEYGPLAVRRFVKADGRALILFALTAPQEQA
jgi:hypothetical protein